MKKKPQRELALAICAAAVSIAFAPLPAAAAPIVVVNGSINMFRDFRAANDVGIAQGDRLQYGANIVGGSLTTSIGATYPPTGFTDPTAPCGPLAVNPNFCANSTPFNVNRLASPWNLTFTRPNEAPLTVTGPSLAGVEFQVPQPTSVTISGAGLTPTISWTLPAGYTPNGFRVQIYDKSQLRPGSATLADVIHSDSVPVTATSYTVPSILDTGSLKFGGNYSINFQIVETRGDVPFTGSNAQILTRSNSFFAFTPLDNSAPPNVALPQVGPDPDPNDNRGAPYQFTIDAVGPSAVTFIDPFVSIGFDYAIGVGDPNFASVLLPDVGDGSFELLFNGAGGPELHIVQDGVQFFFPVGGVAEFSVRGIEESAGLDPGNVTAFVTGLTFVSPGQFTGTMTPITVFVPDAAVPVPGTLALLALGLIGFGRRLIAR